MIDNPRPEHPRPQFVRADWLCLNSQWQFEIDAADIGDWREAQVMQRSLDLNEPLTCFEGGVTLPARSFVQLDAANVTLEAVKRAEHGDGLVIRLVERHNWRTAATLTFDRPVRAASLCNLMEENEAALEPENGCLRVSFKPYEIATVRIQM